MTAPRIDPPPSPKLRPWHLDRSAVVYVRQSPPQQVTDHQEAPARQDALADRAIALGWPRSQVQVIDDDPGKSGQSIAGRPGFQRLLAAVALDRVGLILGLEMSRLARSCKDWHHLLKLCARFRALLADTDGVYDPTEYAARLVLVLVDRVVLTVDPGDERVAVRVEWAGGAVRERTIHRAVQGYRNQQSWSALGARLAELHGRGAAPKAIAALLDREGFRPPKRASGFTAGMVRRLLHELGLRPRVARGVVRRGPVLGRPMVARSGTVPGPLAAHAARVAEEGLAPGPSGRRPGRAMGGAGGRVRTGPPAGVEGGPADVAIPGAVGRITGPGTASRMTASVPSRYAPGGTDASHNFLLGGYCARLIENRLQ